MKSIRFSSSAVLLTVFGILISSCDKPAIRTETGASPQVPEASVVLPLDPKAGSIRIEPESGLLKNGDALTITFPGDMAAKEIIGKEVLPPVVIDPPLQHTFTWSTPRRGIVRLQAWGHEKIARTVTLRPGLADLKGDPVLAGGWGAEFASDRFGLLYVSYLGEGRSPSAPSAEAILDAMPRVELTFSHNVRPAEIARQVSFMDRETHQKFPVRVALDANQPDVPQGITVIEPEAPLPPDREFWLVIERLEESRSGRELPHLRIYPAGRTLKTEATWARGYNQPKRGKFIRVGFSKDIDGAELNTTAFKVEPAVTLGKIETHDSEVLLFGDFQTGADYRVTVKAGIKSRDGSESTGESSWEVAIPERRPAVVLESSHIARRTNTGLVVDFKTCRTGALEWKLASIPAGEFAGVRNRLREFGFFERNDDGDPILDPRDGTVRYESTELLVPALNLPVVASGEVAASPGEEEHPQTIRWPAGTARSGTYLLEISGTDKDGRTCGNRCLVTLSDWWIRHLDTAGEQFIEIKSMKDSSPVAGVEVTSLGEDGKVLASATTGKDGTAAIPKGTSLVLAAGTDGAEILHALDGVTRGVVPWQEDFKAALAATLITDGDVYAPGETVRFFAVVRKRAEDGTLVIPESREAVLSILTEVPGFEPVELGVELDSTGGAAGSWMIPTTVVSGTYNLSLEFDGEQVMRSITITDFRLPDFQTELSAPVVHGDEAVVEVSSTHFHGAANGGAKVRWTAEWLMEDWRTGWEDREEAELPWSYFSFDDRVSPDSSKQGMEGILSSMRKAGDAGDLAGLAVPASAAVRGEGVLDAEGRLRITSECPFSAKSRGPRAQVFWIVEVRDGGGESQREAAGQHVQFAKEILAIDAAQGSEDSIRVELAAVTGEDEPGEGGEADLELLRREVNVSKELVGDHLIRYRNVPVFTSVWKKRVKTPGVHQVQPGQPGDYVIVAKPVDMPGAVVVSREVRGFNGSGDSVVLDDFSAEIIPDKPAYQVGDTASLQIRAPFAGWANVSVETGHVIRSFPAVRLKGDSDRIPLPVLAEYFPNVFVSVHVTSDTGGQGRPAERLAQCELRVIDPLKILTVTPVPEKNTPFLPGSGISGGVKVLAGGKPLAGVPVMVMAVDEALLSLGDWRTPDPTAVFYPDRHHGMASGRALGEEWYEVRRGMLSHSQKGFIIGGGGFYDGGLAARVRENFDSRPLWQTGLKTGADGSAPFSFTAPDALTSYRIVAFAHTAGGAFGTGSGNVSVSKDLRVKPFLPAFLREGDLVQLRCNLEYDGKSPLTVSCSMEASGPVAIEGAASSTVSLRGGLAGLATSSARVQPGSAGKEAVFLFKAEGPEGRSDVIRIRVPILPAYILQTEIQSGELVGGDSWNVLEALDRVPPSAEFPCDVMLSGTSWLPKLANLPDASSRGATLADVASTALCSLIRPQLAGYLPRKNDETPASSLREFQRSMDEINASLIQEGEFGWLPRWPQGSEPDDATTALVAFSLDLVKQALEEAPEGQGHSAAPVPESLTLALDQWRWSVLDPDSRPHRREASPFTQCMALLMESRGSSMVKETRAKALLHSLYTHRETLDFEAKCLLALANHSYQSRAADEDSSQIGLNPAETKQLVDEIEREDAPAAFNPETLGTRTRAEAIRLHTLVQVGRAGSGAAREELRRLMKPVRESSQDLSAQENLWVLLAAKSAIELDSPAKLATLAADLRSTNASENGISIGWLGHPAAALRKYFPQPVRTPFEATWMVRATHRSPVPNAFGSGSLRLSRTLANLTAPERNGSEAAPFQLGDYVLISYLVEGDQTLHQLRIEEQLPAALQLVNPDLPSVRATFSIPTETSGNQAELSYADRRGNSVSLYFDKLPAGRNQYSVLARTEGAGVFSWPAAQAVPIYDKRFRATTADGTVHSKAAP